MPTIEFMSRINFNLSRAEHEESFITSGPGFLAALTGTSVCAMADLNFQVVVIDHFVDLSCFSPFYV